MDKGLSVLFPCLPSNLLGTKIKLEDDKFYVQGAVCRNSARMVVMAYV
jgi:hypothetical protein